MTYVEYTATISSGHWGGQGSVAYFPVSKPAVESFLRAM